MPYPPMKNSILPRQEYRDLFYVRHVGPLDAADFTAYAVSSDSVGATSISSISDSTSLSLATTGSLYSEDAAQVLGASFLFDKTTFLDACMLRAENISTVDLLKLRWLSVGPDQSVRTAFLNQQFATFSAQIGDDSSSEADGGGTGNTESLSYQPLVTHDAREMVINPLYNKVLAGGLLVLLTDDVPTNLVDLRLCLRLRERSF